MGLVKNISKMETSILGNILMAWLMDMESIFGAMVVFIKVTLNMGSDMDTVFGLIKKKLKFTMAATEWTKNKDLECMNGLENRSTRGNLNKTLDKALEDSMNFHLNLLKI